MMEKTAQFCVVKLDQSRKLNPFEISLLEAVANDSVPQKASRTLLRLPKYYLF